MVSNGIVIKSDSGRRIRIDGLIKAGGQGEVYNATETNSGQKGVVKVFHKQFASRDTVHRIRFLLSQNLSSVCPALCAPTDMLNTSDAVGHFSPFAPGEPLEELLVNAEFTFMEALQLASSLAHAIGVLHQRNIAHGDLHADNLIIHRVRSVLQLHVIDIDNFHAPGVPLPPMVGQNLYMAPELRSALKSMQPAIPDLLTDRFSLGVLMHEIILLRHVAAGADDTEAEFQNAMCNGHWIHDPASPDKPTRPPGGYPAEVLSSDLARLFRLALSLDPAARPSPRTWSTETAQAIDNVFLCPKCDGPVIIDGFKVICPFCNTPFPALTMVVGPNGRNVPLTRGSVPIGRKELGGSLKVSSHHAVFRRKGPETTIESHGTNGTYRWGKTGWMRLPDRKPILVQRGDRLLMGDVEVFLN